MKIRLSLAIAAAHVVTAVSSAAMGEPGAGPASAEPVVVHGEPRLIDGRLIFPTDPDAPPVPRFLTEAERQFLRLNPLVAGQNDQDGGGMLRGPITSPTGSVRCPGEYEPSDGIILSWKSFTSIQAQMGALITNQGNATLYVACDSTSVRTSANSALIAAGANMSRVQYLITGTNTVWLRDYGPRYIYEGNVRAIIDHTYNRPRPADDVFPNTFANFKNHGRYVLPLIHGGGNYHLNGLGDAWATRLISNENPTLTDAQIIGYWNQFQNVDTTLTTPFPTTVDSTQHIDMWMQITGDNSAVIADWPNNPGSTQDVVCDTTAAAMISDGWNIARVPARSINGTHYTYTNVVMCNDIVIIPTYTNTIVVNAGHNAQALAAWQAHMPGKQIFQVNCQAIVTSAGVMHCIVMHVPEHLGEAGPNGGLAPTAHLRNFRGGEALNPGESVSIRWLTDDDVSVSNVDLLLSTDGGATYPTTIVAATAPDGNHTWIVPDIYTQQARLKVVARDGVGNTGADESPSDFAINGTPPCPADFDASGSVDVPDIFAFLAAWFAMDESADIDGVPGLAVSDIFFFLSLWFAGC